MPCCADMLIQHLNCSDKPKHQCIHQNYTIFHSTVMICCITYKAFVSHMQIVAQLLQDRSNRSAASSAILAAFTTKSAPKACLCTAADMSRQDRFTGIKSDAAEWCSRVTQQSDAAEFDTDNAATSSEIHELTLMIPEGTDRNPFDVINIAGCFSNCTWILWDSCNLQISQLACRLAQLVWHAGPC